MSILRLWFLYKKEDFFIELLATLFFMSVNIIRYLDLQNTLNQTNVQNTCGSTKIIKIKEAVMKKNFIIRGESSHK